MKSKKFFIWLLAAVSLTFVIGCTKKETISLSPPKQEETLGEETTEETKGKLMTFSLVGFTQGGEKKWEIEGGSAKIMSDKVELENVKICAYFKGGFVTLTAQRGYFDRLTNNVRLEKDVVAVTEEGARLTTDYLDWQAEDGTISTEAGVFVERENITCSGIGAHAAPSLKKVRLNKNVTVRIKSLRPATSGQDPLVTIITCTGPLEIDYEKQIAIFNDDVKVNDERGNIFGDRIDVYLDPKEERITKAVALGNVRILREGNVTYSQKAVYEAKENRLTLSGRPRLVIYSAKE